MVSLVALAVLVAIATASRRFRNAMSTVDSREPIGVRQNYESHYRMTGVSFSDFNELWLLLSSLLGVSPEKLRITDLLGIDVGQTLLTSEELDELYETAYERYPSFRNYDPAKLRTIDDFVRACLGIMAEGECGQSARRVPEKLQATD